jgi:hypothetical protein
MVDGLRGNVIDSGQAVSLQHRESRCIANLDPHGHRTVASGIGVPESNRVPVSRSDAAKRE